MNLLVRLVEWFSAGEPDYGAGWHSPSPDHLRKIPASKQRNNFDQVDRFHKLGSLVNCCFGLQDNDMRQLAIGKNNGEKQ